MVIGLGVAGFAGTLSGDWNLDICTTDLDDFTVTSVLNVDYTLGDWVFGMNSVFLSTDALVDLSFDVAGLLGAFSIYSLLDFSGTAYQSWNTAASVSIAGVDLWVITALVREGFTYAIGGHGVAGDVEIWAEVDFGLGSQISSWYTYGFGYLVDWEPYYSCIYGWTNGAITPQTNDCDPVFSGFAIWAEAPFCCLDVLAKLSFDCNGFVDFCVELNDIDLGAGWFQLDDFNICFTTQTKSITGVDFTLTLGDAVCVKPYFDVSMDGTYIVDGIALHALLLECEFNGVTFKAGELLLKTKYIGFTPTGSLWLTAYSTITDCYIVGAEEYFAVEIDGDSCCGGAFDASFYVFFDIDSWGDGIFDWMYFIGGVTVGIGPNIDLSFDLETDPSDVQKLCIGFDYSF